MLLTSDHHPVRASFNVPIVDFTQPPETPGALSIKITNLQAQDLRAADLNGLSDPYCVFISTLMVDPSGKVKTATKPKTLNPEWADSDVPDISLKYSSLDFLGERCITVTVWDSDLLSANDLIGQGRISLKPLIDAKLAESNSVVPFELKLTFNGAAKAGTLKGMMSLVGSVDASASTLVVPRQGRDSSM
jgi:Ca2+-dependent lipid-binding protein